MQLTLSRRRPILYRNQSIDLQSKSVDWFLYDISLHRERVKGLNQTLETSPNQTSIVTCVRVMNQKLKDQLVMKFQLAHFIAIHGKPFKLYSDFANFEKEFHNVDLGNSYLSNTSCHEMLTFLVDQSLQII